MGKLSSDSFRQVVRNYIRDHPIILTKKGKGSMDELYEAFPDTDKQLLITYKAEYINELEFAKFDAQQAKLNPPPEVPELPKKKITKKYASIMAKLQSWDKVVKCPHCPGLYANEVMKFVGFRGNIDKNGICHLDLKGKEYHGEAHPPPIVPVTNVNRENLMKHTGFTREQLGSRFFLGILKYEVEIMSLIFLLRNIGYENIALLMARGHGKTYIWCWNDQIRLKHFPYNIMLLSETNARLKVGNWVYVWALKNNYLKDPEKYARKSTYQHFDLLNNNRMDIYKYSEEALVGEHDYILKLDDVVKRKWRERPTENEKMINHFQSNINFIIRTGFEICGTCKFEGDLINHIITNIEDIVVIIQTPFIECPHGNINEKGTYIECDICRDDCLIAPEIHSYDSLMKKKDEDIEAWWAEMMQDPHPMEGGVWSEITTQFEVETPYVKYYDAFFIYVDRATTLNQKSDLTGCVMGLRNYRTGVRLVTHDYTDNIEFEQLLVIINDVVIEIHNKYEHMSIHLIVEKQGGGDDFYTMVTTRNYFERGDGTLVENKIRDYCHIEMISSTGNKILRIKDRLYAPIKNARIQFLESLKRSILVESILMFPNCKYFDAIDALATGDFYMSQLPIVNIDRYIETLRISYEDMKLITTPEQKKLDNRLAMKDQEGIRNLHSKRRRTLF